jgi:deazaflavin-dependent oxidoreductase (nitroreductase family)
MDEAIREALARDRTIDLTTTGRRSGEPQRIEIWFHSIDGRLYITGLPGRRGWYANLLADPALTFHLKESVRADLAGHARPVTQQEERRAVLAPILARLGGNRNLDDWVARAPLVEVQLDGAADAST